ncbi:MAG: SDR family NAD(P)-dependent oxidoreductase [Thermodesulfobacteriota bacterium]
MAIPNLLLPNKTALVTGARRGLGRAIALALAEAGADVAVCDRVEEDGDLTATCKAIEGLGRRSLGLLTDLTQKAEVENLIQKIKGAWGGLDILVNNAGGRAGLSPLLHETSEEDWQSVMDNNLKAAFLCSQAAVKGMIERRKGNILNMASAAGLKAFTKRGSYNIAKAGIIMLTRNLAWDLGKYNIRVNALAPSQALTEGVRNRMDPETREKAEKSYPLRRLAGVEEVLGPVLFLVSEASSYITGHTLVMDGGLLA